MSNILTCGIHELVHQKSFSAIEVKLRKEKSQKWKHNGISQKQTDCQHDGPCYAVKKQHLRVWNSRALDGWHSPSARGLLSWTIFRCMAVLGREVYGCGDKLLCHLPKDSPPFVQMDFKGGPYNRVSSCSSWEQVIVSLPTSSASQKFLWEIPLLRLKFPYMYQHLFIFGCSENRRFQPHFNNERRMKWDFLCPQKSWFKTSFQLSGWNWKIGMWQWCSRILQGAWSWLHGSMQFFVADAEPMKQTFPVYFFWGIWRRKDLLQKHLQLI